MGNFCTNCGRELQEGETCNCQETINTQPEVTPAEPVQEAAPQPAPAPQPTPAPTPATPSQTSLDVNNGFKNLVSAITGIFKNPEGVAETLSKKENWLVAIILVAIQALFSGIFSLATVCVGMGMSFIPFANIFVMFIVTFIGSIFISAALMGMTLGLGKAFKGTGDIKSALAVTGVRCFITIPFTLVSIIFTMLNTGFGLFFFIVGEIFAIMMLFMAIQKGFALSANRAFAIVGITYVVMLIVFAIIFIIYINSQGTSLLMGSMFGGMDSLFGGGGSDSLFGGSSDSYDLNNSLDELGDLLDDLN